MEVFPKYISIVFFVLCKSFSLLFAEKFFFLLFKNSFSWLLDLFTSSQFLSSNLATFCCTFFYWSRLGWVSCMTDAARDLMARPLRSFTNPSQFLTSFIKIYALYNQCTFYFMEFLSWLVYYLGSKWISK